MLAPAWDFNIGGGCHARMAVLPRGRERVRAIRAGAQRSINPAKPLPLMAETGRRALSLRTIQRKTKLRAEDTLTPERATGSVAFVSATSRFRFASQLLCGDRGSQ